MTGQDPQKLPAAPRRQSIAFILVASIALLVGVAGQEWRWRSSSPEPSGDLQLAEKAFRQGDNQAALTLFNKLADHNDPTADYWLALMSESGLGVPRDPEQAIALYKKAADREVVAAQLRLGEIYLHGDIVLPDLALAKSYLEKAAYHGDAQAAMLLGQMYRTGLAAPANPMEAYAWSEVATLEGSAFAQSERDASLHGLSVTDEQAGIARARVILDQIKVAAKPTPSAHSAASTPPAAPSPSPSAVPQVPMGK